MNGVRALARRHPVVVDALGAAALYTLSVADLPDSALDVRTPRVLVVLAVVVAALAVRRRWPLWTLGVTTLGVVLAAAFGSDLEPFLVAVAIATYTVAVRTGRWTVPRAAVPVALFLVLAVVLLPGLSWDGLGRFAFVGMAAAAGEAVRNRRAYVAAVEERAVRAERTRAEEARRQVAEERLHIARELHDVVAHHIAVINVQAGAAGHLLTARPGAAADALAHVRRSSRAVLDELGGLLSVLRRPEDLDSPTEPAPGMARLESLMATFRASGLDLRWTSTGEVRELPATVDLVAYRVVQEALTNAHRYGTDTARLAVAYTPAELVLDIVNPLGPRPRAIGSGLGLLGMRERAGAVGGTIRAGVEPDGRFHVHVTLPLRLGRNP
ncbi:sensor histidine kinase [Actinophytocola sp.]|uniref:sensor histidine kinase n=1 Tax=Actinophytocola sp. TaxID=1872138 RepID=UPI002D6D3036|nr:histidine kinase [Actinophytocola sp.]HYQ63916.1 histidine kinase [Actinophytocola sp.]